MTRSIGQPVLLLHGPRQTVGEVQIERWTRNRRAVRADRALLVVWALAAVSLLIPVAHFVLVPGLLVAGPVAAFVVMRQRSAVVGGQGTCPACGERVTIMRAAERWPLDEVCESCRSALTIEPAC